MSAYYNEIDPFAAQWLRNLIAAGHIAPGDVDERSIVDILPNDLKEYTQCHFFAGIGVWSYGLRLAGWSDDRPIWTGSCPCQPFSASGKRGGFDDERHLWPSWQHLIEQCKPSRIVGEQVASKDGYAWLDLVQADMEGMGYACGAVVSPSAGYGAPHERHRQFFGAIFEGEVVGVAHDSRSQGRRKPERQRADQLVVGPGGLAIELGFPAGVGFERLGDKPEYSVIVPTIPSVSSVADSRRERRDRKQVCIFSGETRQDRTEIAGGGGIGDHGSIGPTNGFWRDADWLFCRDERWRAVEPGTFPLAHGTAARVGRLRGYGNAINAQQAKAFIEAFDETIDDMGAQVNER